LEFAKKKMCRTGPTLPLSVLKFDSEQVEKLLFLGLAIPYFRFQLLFACSLISQNTIMTKTDAK
jgi:hypothetical protein